MMNCAIPSTLVISLAGLPETIEQTFPLGESDRDELVRQVFEFYLNENTLANYSHFRPLIERLRWYQNNSHVDDTAQHLLWALALDIHALIYAQLKALNFEEVIAAQGGFFYIFEGFLSNGYYAVLKNIAPIPPSFF